MGLKTHIRIAFRDVGKGWFNLDQGGLVRAPAARSCVCCTARWSLTAGLCVCHAARRVDDRGVMYVSRCEAVTDYGDMFVSRTGSDYGDMFALRCLARGVTMGICLRHGV
eukprot:1185158-Prorocentrum_minimum.AAC.1